MLIVGVKEGREFLEKSPVREEKNCLTAGILEAVMPANISISLYVFVRYGYKRKISVI